MTVDSFREKVKELGPPPGHDPVDRLRHTLHAFDDTANEERVLTATSNVYGRDSWTGITYGDLREILRRLENG